MAEQGSLDGVLEGPLGDTWSHGMERSDRIAVPAPVTLCDTTNGIMRAKHRRTLERMFARPTPADIRWPDIEAMLWAADVEISERSGSRVLLKKGSERMIVHRPHPAPEVGRATVRDIVVFLEVAGVKP